MPIRHQEYHLDPDSSIVKYDEKGVPKKFIPSRWDNTWGWLYVTNPNKEGKKLEGKELEAHLRNIERTKKQLSTGV